MKTHELEVKKFLKEYKYFEGNVEDTIILNNGMAIALDNNDSFAKYSLIRLGRNVGNYNRETNVSNSVLSMLTLSFVLDELEKSDSYAYGFVETLLETGYTYENDEELAEELKVYDGDSLEFLLEKSRVVNDNNYETYKEIISRVIAEYKENK